MSEIQAQPNKLEIGFNFRKNKETGLKRKSVELVHTFPTADEIVAILNDTSEGNKKTRAMVLDQVYSPIISAIRSRVDANEDFNQETLDAIDPAELSLTTLANLPRSERSTTTKEELEAFADSYVSVMVENEKISKAGGEQAKALIVGRFKQVAGDTAILKRMQTRLNEYVELAGDEALGEHEKALTTLVTKLEEALSVDFSADVL